MTLIKRLTWLLPVFLFITLTSRADTAQVYVNGSYAFADNGYGIGPYGGTLDGNSASFFCVDFNHDIVGNTNWTANVTGLTSSSYANTLLNNQNTYLEMAWLITQMLSTSNQTLQAEYQWAIWSLSVGNNAQLPYNPYGTNAMWVGDAQAAVNGGWTVSGWTILTPISGTSPNFPGTYYGQEFMVVGTPEPKSIVLLFAGLALFFVFALKK